MRAQIHFLGKALMLVSSVAMLWLYTPEQAYGAPPDEPCTVAHVAGAYGAIGNGGTIIKGNVLGLPAGPFAVVGRVELDGHGNIFIVESASFNGAIIRNVTDQGTYSVNDDCTGTIVAGGGTDTADIVFVNNRNEVYGMDTASGIVGNFIFKRITP